MDVDSAPFTPKKRASDGDVDMDDSPVCYCLDFIRAETERRTRIHSIQNKPVIDDGGITRNPEASADAEDKGHIPRKAPRLVSTYIRSEPLDVASPYLSTR